MADGKTITVNTDDNTVTVQQTNIPTDEGLNVGGVSLNTDLPWYGDAFIAVSYTHLTLPTNREV